jgi:hypothetical protein
MQISKETYNLFYAFAQQVNAKESLEVIHNSKEVAYNSKNFVNKQLTRLNANIRDLRLLLPEQDMKVLDKEMLDNEVTLQVENIRAMIADLPKAKRDEIERYIEVQHKVYKQN